MERPRPQAMESEVRLEKWRAGSGAPEGSEPAR